MRRCRRAFPPLVLVVVAVAAAPSPAAPVFYGRLDMSLTWSDSGRAPHEPVAGTSLENNFTRVGLRGERPLGDAWSLFYRIEAGVQAEDQAAAKTPFTSRPTYVGIAGPWGRLAAGRIDPVFKMTKGFVDAFDNYATKHDRLLPGDKRHGDSLEYKTPRWGRLQAGASYLLADEYYPVGDPRRENPNLQLAATWGDKRFRTGPVYAAVAWNDGIEDFRGTRLVAMAAVGRWTVGGLAQWTELLEPGAPDLAARDGFGAFASLACRLGAWRLKAQAGRDDSGTGLIARRAYADSDAAIAAVPTVTGLALGWERSFGPDFRLHGEWGRFTVDGVDGYDDTVVSLGLRHDFEMTAPE